MDESGETSAKKGAARKKAAKKAPGKKAGKKGPAKKKAVAKKGPAKKKAAAKKGPAKKGAAKKKAGKKSPAKKAGKKKAAAKKGPAKKKAAKKGPAKKAGKKKAAAKKGPAKKKAAKKGPAKKAGKKGPGKKKAAKKASAEREPEDTGDQLEQASDEQADEAPDNLVEAFQTRLPIQGEGFSLELGQITHFGWGSGLSGILRLALGDAEEPRELEVPLLRSDDLAFVDWSEVEAALDRWVARVKAMSSEDAARLGVEGLAPWAEATPEELESRYAEYLASVRPETSVDTELRRRAALQQAYVAFPRLAEHVQRVFGLTLPRTLAVYHAFHLALANLPYPVRNASSTSPGGILDRLAPRGWDLPLRPGLDERVHCRFRQDPPEMLTFAWGNSDGLHFGLWYDTADEAIAVVHNYARDSAETWITGDHPLSVCRYRWRYDEPPPDETGFAIRLYLEELAWFEEEERRAAGDTSASALGNRPALLGGPGSIPEAELPLDVSLRADAYRSDPGTVREWLTQARNELEAGNPAMALALGRELHWFDHDAYRVEAGALLVRAYEALGRTAHAGILRVHIALRNEASVDVLDHSVRSDDAGGEDEKAVGDGKAADDEEAADVEDDGDEEADGDDGEEADDEKADGGNDDEKASDGDDVVDEKSDDGDDEEADDDEKAGDRDDVVDEKADVGNDDEKADDDDDEEADDDDVDEKADDDDVDEKADAGNDDEKVGGDEKANDDDVDDDDDDVDDDD